MPATSQPPSSSPLTSPLAIDDPQTRVLPAWGSRHVVVVAGGSPPDPRVMTRLADVAPGTGPPTVIAADRGFDHALELGLQPDMLIGDLDSIKPESIEQAMADGVRIERHPPDKEATDLELALDRATALAPTVTVLIGTGPDDRLDHLAAQFGLLASPAFASTAIDAWIGRAHLQVVHGPGDRTIRGRPYELVTLLPVGGPAVGVTTTGLRFSLHGETLDPFSTRGVSNEIAATLPDRAADATVALERGTLLIIRPNALEGHP